MENGEDPQCSVPEQKKYFLIFIHSFILAFLLVVYYTQCTLYLTSHCLLFSLPSVLQHVQFEIRGQT